MTHAIEDAVTRVPDLFSIHHLVWLHRNNFIPNLPYELGPFPITLDFAATGKFDAKLRAQLIEWGVLSGDGNSILPEAESLLTALTGNAEWTLWGTILLYSLRTTAVKDFDPEGADEWGLKHAVRDVPRVPFLIAVRSREVITALSTPDALIINRLPRAGDVHRVAAKALRGMLDPQQNWEPWGGPTISVPHTTVKALAEDPSVSKLDGEDGTPEAVSSRVEGTKTALASYDLPRATSDALLELQSHPTTANVQVSINYTSVHGQVSPKLAMGVTFFDGAGIVVSYPVGKTDETRSIRYVPGDENGFVNGIKSLVEIAERLHA